MGRIARLVPLVVLVAAVVVGRYYFSETETRGRTVVLFSPIAGPDPLAAQITEKLSAALADPDGEHGLSIVRQLKSPITEEQGGNVAATIGAQRRAALVVWGYIKATESDEFLHVVVERLGAATPFRLNPFGDYVAEGALEEPRQFIVAGRVDDGLGAQSLLLQAVLQHETEDYPKAAAAFDTLLTLGHSEGRAEVLLSRGNVALLMGKPPEALEDYAVLQSGVLASQARSNRGLAYAALGQHRLAVAEYATALRIHPELEAPRLNLGISQAALGEHHSAISNYEHILQFNPRAAGAYLNRGVSRAALGDHRQAIDDFTRAIRINRRASAYLNRGLSHAALGEHQPAIDDFTRSLQAHRADPAALVSRRRSRSVVKEHTAAIADFTTALELNPQMAPAYYERGVVYTILGRHQLAVDDFSAALRINPRLGEAYKGRGVTQLLRRDYPGAINDFSRAIGIDPNDAEAFFHRGIAYRLRGEPLKALPDMGKVLELSRNPSLRKQADEQVRQIRAEP